MPDELSPKSKESIASILKYLSIGGLLGLGSGTLLNVLSNFRQTAENTEVEKDLDQLSKPYKIIKIKPKYLRDRSSLIDEALLNKALEAESQFKTAGAKEGESIIAPWAEIPIKWIGGIAAGLAGLYGSNKLFSIFKQKALKSELEDAKNQYYTALYMRKRLQDIANEEEKHTSSLYRYASDNSEELEKFAAWGVTDYVLGGTLSAILGAAIMHTLSARKLGKLKNPYITGRKAIYRSGLTSADLDTPMVKFVIDNDDTENTDSEAIKLSSEQDIYKYIDPTKMLADDAAESVVKLAAKLEREALTNGGVNDFIDAVALGKIDMLKSASSFEDMMKKASEFASENKKVASELDKSLAVSYIVSDPILSSVFVPYACAEIQEQNPMVTKLASLLEEAPGAVEDAIGFTAAFNIKEKGELMKDFVKKANFDDNDSLDLYTEKEFDIHQAIETYLKSDKEV